MSACAAIPLTLSGSVPARDLERRDPADELVALIHVEDQDADAAVFDVVANARLGHVEQMPFSVARQARGPD